MAKKQSYSGALALVLLASAVLLPSGIRAQDTTDTKEVSGRHPDHCLRWRGLGMAAGMGVGIALLDQAWYAQYERGPLKLFNDGDEWLQMDKAGHVFSAYTLGAWGHALLQPCRPNDRRPLWWGSMAGLGFLTAVEVLDGTSAAWGFSVWDMVANVAGTSLYLGQELAWKEQRIRLKLSARHTDLAQRRPELLGEGNLERYLKDYNGMTLWMSLNPASFNGGGTGFWDLLNIAFGYGAYGMITASAPEGPGALGSDLERRRRFFLSPDLDLRRIPTKRKGVRTALFILNSIKIPAPALEWSQGRFTGHWVYF